MIPPKLIPIIVIPVAVLVGVIVSMVNDFVIQCLILVSWTIGLTIFMLAKHGPELKKELNKKKEGSDGV